MYILEAFYLLLMYVYACTQEEEILAPFVSKSGPQNSVSVSFDNRGGN